jgi:hypothetical protein
MSYSALDGSSSSEHARGQSCDATTIGSNTITIHIMIAKIECWAAHEHTTSCYWPASRKNAIASSCGGGCRSERWSALSAHTRVEDRGDVVIAWRALTYMCTSHEVYAPSCRRIRRFGREDASCFTYMESSCNLFLPMYVWQTYTWLAATPRCFAVNLKYIHCVVHCSRQTSSALNTFFWRRMFWKRTTVTANNAHRQCIFLYFEYMVSILQRPLTSRWSCMVSHDRTTDRIR